MNRPIGVIITAFCLVHAAEQKNKNNRKTKNNMKIKTNLKAGFTLVEIMIVVAIIGLLAAIAIPNFVKARTTAQKNACIANLNQIKGAIEQWALEEKKGPTAAVALTDISGDNTKHIAKAINTGLQCPGSGTYTVADVQTDPTCTLSADGHVL